MRVQRVDLDAADPMQVYRLVRAHLRGAVRGEGAAAPARGTPAAAKGLAGTDDDAPPRRRSARGGVAHARMRNPKGGLFFTDWFLNNYIENFWARRTPQAGEFIETNTLETDYTGISTDAAGSSGNFKNLLMTATEAYDDVRVEATFFMQTVSDQAVVVARGNSNGTDLLDGYVLGLSPNSGALELSQISGGVETILASTGTPTGVEVFTLYLQCVGDTISGGLVGGKGVGPVVVALHARGQIGFGNRFGTAEYVVGPFRAMAP